MNFYHQLPLPQLPLCFHSCLDFDRRDLVDVVNDSQPVSYGHVYRDGEGIPQRVCRYRFGRLQDPSLCQWLYHNLPQAAQLRFMAFESSHGLFPPHIDGRRWALNYVIDTGGAGVRTQWYQQRDHSLVREHKQPGYQIDSSTEHIWWHNMQLVAEIEMLPCTWYLIRTDILHGVTDIPDQRRAISCTVPLSWAEHQLREHA
jgi:hypothetical protein